MELILLLLLWRRHRLLSRPSYLIEENEDDTEDLFPLFLLKKEFVYSRNRKEFYKPLSFLERQRRQKKIPRCCLLNPKKCAWQRLYEGGSDAAMITLTGLDRESFAELEQKFRRYYNLFTPHTLSGMISKRGNSYRGRRRLMISKDCLALCLSWTRTRGGMYVLQMIFGVTGTAVSWQIGSSVFGRALASAVNLRRRLSKSRALAGQAKLYRTASPSQSSPPMGRFSSARSNKVSTSSCV